VAEENTAARLGAHHTLDLELNRQVTLEKVAGWDSMAIQMLRDAVGNASRATTWAVMVSEGFASLWFLTDFRTVWCHNLSATIPKKDNADAAKRLKQTTKFHATVLDSLARLMDMPSPSTSGWEAKPLLIAGTGNDPAVFAAYIKSVASGTQNKPMAALAAAVVVAPAASTSAAALSEVLATPTVRAKLADTAFARDMTLLDRFEKSMRADDGRIAYGPKQVESAVSKGAVGRGGGTLLISNRLFRSLDVAERKRWVDLVERVREVEGGDVRVLNEMHESGKRLQVVGDVAALLTFPIYDDDDDDDDEDNDD
jgi:protein pelota